MGNHKTYEESIKYVYFGLGLLAAVTLIEVFVSLFGKGHLGGGVENISWLVYPIALALIGLSLYKAYFIIYKFMHMGDEVKSLGASVLLPMLLLVWGIIAFFQDGNAWRTARADVLSKGKIEAPASIKVIKGADRKDEMKVTPVPVHDDHGHDDHGHEGHDH